MEMAKKHERTNRMPHWIVVPILLGFVVLRLGLTESTAADDTKKAVKDEKPAAPTAKDKEPPSKASSSPGASDEFAKIQPLLKKYCFSCHEGAKAKNGFQLDTLEPDFSAAKSLAAWKDVLERMTAQVMPPKKNPQLKTDEAKLVTDWIAGKVSAAESASKAVDGRVVLRRLNREEYQNTLRDLLGLDNNVKDMLPDDRSYNGFDNVGSALTVSSVLIQRYLDAADRALARFFTDFGPEPKVEKKKVFNKNEYRIKPELAESGKQYLLLKDDSVVYFNGAESGYQPFETNQFAARVPGIYKVRISAYGYQSNGKPMTMAVYAGEQQGGGLVPQGVDYFDVPADQPGIVEFSRYFKENQTIKIVPYGLGYNNIGNAAVWKGKGLAVQWEEFEGPFHESWPTPAHQRVMGKVDRKKGTLRDAEQIIRNFMPRAYRRPVSDVEMQPYLDLVRTRMRDGGTFEYALRTGLKGVLCSPDFLFLVEKTGKLDDYALASRLSYFLWSSMPDDELIQLASKGTLGTPEVLKQQVERLLQSPKAAAFTDNFLGQWLDLRNIDATFPDRSYLGLYQEYDELLKFSMVKETRSFFEELLKNDLSVLNVVDSKFVMINRPLANLYKIKGVDSIEIQKVTLPAHSHRGGVLTQAAVLKVTANGTTTSPVLRGVWVLKNILGQPMPPPPSNVAAVEPDTRGTSTIRQQLAKHRTIDVCASCHTKIDPVGFVLESYDVIGGWRDVYRSHDPRQRKKVEPADVMPDGKRFRDIDEFKAILLANPDQIARTLTEKLVIYSTGGTVGVSDKEALDDIVKRIQGHDYGLRTLIHEIVQSKLFLTK